MSDDSLLPRRTGDGSFSLFSARHQEGFHSAAGALQEAWAKFVAPAGLERFAPGRLLRVVEVAVGTGTNTVTLVQALQARGLTLDWWGLERDPRPLQLALAEPAFRRQWPAPALAGATALWHSDHLLWGDARHRLSDLPEQLAEQCDLVLLDAFSPRRCPELWSLEFLSGLARLLAPDGRLLTYCSAAAVRRALELAGLQVAAIRPVGTGAAQWSGGSVASPSPLAPDAVLRPLTAMEREHLASRAGEPYRDPTGQATSAWILAERARNQAASSAESGSAWQRRWGSGRHHSFRLGRSPGGSGEDR